MTRSYRADPRSDTSLPPCSQVTSKLSDYLLAELCRFAERLSPEEMRRRLADRPPVEPPESAVAAVRAERDAQLPQ